MAKVIQCPHLACISLSRYCLDGRWPVNCETCNSKDKQWVEEISTNVANGIFLK